MPQTTDVVVIDDTPPASPVKSKTYKHNHITITFNTNSSFTPCNLNDLLKMNQKIILTEKYDNDNSKSKTANNDVINLTVDKEKIIDPNLRKDLQDRGVIIRSKKTCDNSQVENMNDRSSQHRNIQQCRNNTELCDVFGFNTNFEKPVYLPSYETYTLAQSKNIPTYCDNFINVKYDENYQFIPENFANNERYSMQYMPEFIDINNFINYGSFGGSHFMSSENLINVNNIYQTVNIDTNSSNIRKEENNPISLKRKHQTSIDNSSKVIDLSNEDSNDKMDTSNQINEASTTDDDLEIVYVGAYAREPKYQTLPHTVYKLPSYDDDKENSPSDLNRESPISISESISDSQNSKEGGVSNDDKNKGKRKRKPTLTVPRRNPKRQVQIEKDYLKLLDNVIIESKKDAKPKKPKKTNRSSSDNKRVSTSNTKKTRQTLNVGAVYRPPSPLSLHHLREWPQSVNHPNTKSSLNESTTSDPDCSKEKKELKWICHEMLHHVLAYSATVKSFINNDIEEEKSSFLKDLSLTDTLTTPLNLTKNNKIVLYNTETKEDKRKIEDGIRELISNSLLLYSITNEVNKDNLAKYIQSINPEDVIDWSNRQLSLVE